MKSAVVLVNLGTPDQPTSGAIRKFLRRFLSDKRVVEIPRPIWWLILYLFILPLRPLRLQARYREIWIAGQSPLNYYGDRLVAALGQQLQQRAAGSAINVVAAMTYSEPSIDDTIDQLCADGVERILFVPLYPQYSATTTAAVHDQIANKMASMRAIPQWYWVRDYHDNARYIDGMAQSVAAQRAQQGSGEYLVMSFHGIPQRNVDLGDPYQQQCEQTAGMLAAKLGLEDTQWRIAYQSRLGRAQWLQPYTRDVLVGLASNGVKTVDVICPSFAVDCLETLEEISVELAEEFVEAGGEKLNYIPCLNDSPVQVALMCDLIEAVQFSSLKK